MRKFILLAILITGYTCFAQPIKQYLGSTKTMLVSKATYKADSGIYVTILDTLNHPYKDSVGMMTVRPQNGKAYLRSLTKWELLSGNDWTTTGNSGTNPATNFIGTTDEQPLIFKANNQKAGRIDYFLNTANTFYGYKSGNVNSGVGNTGNGYHALLGNTTGGGNTANGVFSLSSNTTGLNNTAIGNSALSTNNGSYNTAIGSHTLESNTIGSGSQAIGSDALYTNTTGSNNTAIGYSSMLNNLNGSANIALGSQSLYSNTSGSGNIALGPISLITNTTGSYNTGLGYNTNVVSNNLTNATAVGYGALVGASNSLVLGSINGVNSASADTKVGIGVTSPTERLHIVGNLRLVNGSQGNGKILTSDANGLSAWADPVNISGKLNISDTSAMLAPYLLEADTPGLLANYQPLDADLTAIAALTPSNDDIIQRKAGVWTNRTPAEFKADLLLTKDDVGLPDADNTSDLDKPISSATQTALDLKLNIADAYTDEKSQDATGSMVDATLVYNDGIPSLGRAAINGDVIINAGSNTSAITAGVIINSNINAGAAIDATKLIDGSISNTELGYINTLTSNAQTQISNKVTKGGDAGAFSLGTTGAGEDLTIKLGNNDRWTFGGTNGYLRRGSGSEIHGLQLYGTGAGSVIAFGDNFGSDPYVGLREKGGTDTDQMEAFGQKGFYVTTGTYGGTSKLTVQQDGDIILGGETQVAGAELTVIGDEDVSGNLNVHGDLTAANIYKGSATLDFPSTGATAVSDLTITVTGAAVGDPVSLGVPEGSMTTTASFTARVSSANTVTVRYSPKATENPASGTFKVKVFKY